MSCKNVALSVFALALLGLGGCPKDDAEGGPDGGTADEGGGSGDDGAGKGGRAGEDGAGRGGASGKDGAGEGGSEAGAGGAAGHDGDEAGAGGGGGDAPTQGGDHSCAEIGAANAALASELGCLPDNEIEDGCEMLYARDVCVAEWEALIECVDISSSDNFACSAEHDNEIRPKDDVCVAEHTAFDTCFAH